MAKNVLLVLGSPKGDFIHDIEPRTEDLCSFLDSGGITKDDGTPLNSNDFDYAYLAKEDCYTASGVISPTKWAKYKLSPTELAELFKPYKAVVTLDATATKLITSDRFTEAIKNKYSYASKAVFPTQVVSMEDERFLSLINRIDTAYAFTEAGEIPQPKLTECIVIDTIEGVKTMMQACYKTGLCVFDVETNEIDNGKKEGRLQYYKEGFKVTTLSISPCAGISYVTSIEHKDKVLSANVFEYLIIALRTLFVEETITKVAHNLKYDLNALSVYGITEYKGRFADTMLMAHLINEAESVGLERLTEMYLPTFHGYKIKNFNIGFGELAKYNAQDTDNTCRLFNFLEIKLRDDMRKYKLYRSVIMPTFWELYYAERHGALIDTDFIEQSIIDCEALIEEKYQELLTFQEVKDFIEKQGKEINFGSPKQLSELLYGSEGFKIKAFDQDTGEPSTSTAAEILATIDHPFIEILQQYRGLNKTLGTFFIGIRDKVHEGVIHTQFKIHGTRTGRASCVTYSTKILLETGKVEIGKIIPEFEGARDIRYLGLQALTHDGTYQLITHGINQGNQEVYEVELESGEIVKCTLEHKFLTNKGWYCLKDIISLQSESNFIDNLKILAYGKSS